jgi:hypothetical protein
MAVSLLFNPDARLVVGVEDDCETGGVRVYIGARYQNRYSLIVAPDDCERARLAWSSTRRHVVANFQDLWPIHDEGSSRAAAEETRDGA